MKNKIAVMICLTLLFSCLYLIPSHAATFYDNWNYIAITGNGSGYYITMSSTNRTVSFNSNNIMSWQSNTDLYYATTGIYSSTIKQFASVGEAISWLNGTPYNSSGAVSNQNSIITIKGETYLSENSSIPREGTFFGNYADYEESIQPSWWDNVKQAFMDFVGSEAFSDILSGDWLSYINDVLFGDLWTIKVGEGEDDLIVPETVSATPTPSPTPIPTPIPYSTVIDPGTGEIHYHYTIDVSGTPIPTSSIYPPVTSSPPGPGSGSTIDEPVAVEDYYEPEDSLSVPKLRIFKFLLRMTGNDVDVGMDSLDDNMAVMDATLEDNAEAISGVGDLFQLIPVKWFILIGTLACFPVIAAMIKSLLGG